MMKQNKDWTDAMRSAFRDAEVTPPADGWARLERELGAPAPRVSLLRTYWPRIAAAAAVILLFVAAGEFLWRTEVMPGGADRELAVVPEQAETPVAAAQEAASGAVQEATPRTEENAASEDAQAVMPPVDNKTAESSSSLLASATAVRGMSATAHRAENAVSEAVPANDGVSVQMSETAVVPVAEPAPESGAAELASQNDAASGKVSNAAAPKSEVREQAPDSRTRSLAAAASQSNRAASSGGKYIAYAPVRKPTSLALFGGGGVTGSKQGTGPVKRSMLSAAPSLDGAQTMLLPEPDYLESSFRHHQAFGFGLSVRKELPRGFSVETGVVYTLLMSEVRLPFGVEELNQKLHFIGVPVRANWNFLQRKHFNLYIGAGGMIEKCVSAKFGDKSIDEPGVQWSVMGAAGAEYRMGGHMSLYFEPEVSYYFTETGLRTSRTDSPATFTMRLGLRYSF